MDVSSINNLLPRTSSTNTSSEGAEIINENATFQAALDEATGKIENAKSRDLKVMTAAEIEQRDKDLKEASVELEAILLKMMYGEMYKTVPKDELFGDDNAMEIYQDMYQGELTKEMAHSGGIGLANFIYKQLASK
ncbi:MAG: rod-binding protein [Selenomonadaceae bacterium]|nr:rod-binding protein [Selenomonadaceae bacterium]